jgi:uncharacterized protein YndB with AHSA1/START domain
MADNAKTREIVVEAVLPHDPETVWRALTTSQLISRWLMPNDFVAVVGARCHFRTKPMGDWDGVVDCEVIEVVPHRKLVYRWQGGSDNNARYGSRLDSVVTWTLSPIEGGTRLRLVHAGFRSPENDFAFDAMSPGWRRVMDSIGKVAGQQA